MLAVHHRDRCGPFAGDDATCVITVTVHVKATTSTLLLNRLTIPFTVMVKRVEVDNAKWIFAMVTSYLALLADGYMAPVTSGTCGLTQPPTAYWALPHHPR